MEKVNNIPAIARARALLQNGEPWEALVDGSAYERAKSNPTPSNFVLGVKKDHSKMASAINKAISKRLRAEKTKLVFNSRKLKVFQDDNKLSMEDLEEILQEISSGEEVLPALQLHVERVYEKQL
jgi:hypothetical protein